MTAWSNTGNPRINVQAAALPAGGIFLETTVKGWTERGCGRSGDACLHRFI